MTPVCGGARPGERLQPSELPDLGGYPVTPARDAAGSRSGNSWGVRHDGIPSQPHHDVIIAGLNLGLIGNPVISSDRPVPSYDDMSLRRYNIRQ